MSQYLINKLAAEMSDKYSSDEYSFTSNADSSDLPYKLFDIRELLLGKLKDPKYDEAQEEIHGVVRALNKLTSRCLALGISML